jgi:serine/threonine protein kinase
MDPTTGPTAARRVAGRYRLEAVLGRGGMGVVWAAQDELLGRPVAIKEVLAAPGLTPEQVAEARRRTVHEARTAARLSSPAAVLVLDVVEEDGEPWVVMERLAPRTLADVLDERRRLPEHDVVTLGLRLLDGLDAAHAAGVLHRDIKPGNVMFRGDPQPHNAVLTDFGIARLVGDVTTTATGMIIGSPAFVAPERARGDRATPASDLWALGVTLWIAAEGVSPFAREGPLPTLTAVLTADPPPIQHARRLEPALTGLLRKDPAERLDARELRALLHRAEAEAPASPAGAQADRTLRTPAVVAPEAPAAPAVERPAMVSTGAPTAPAPEAPADRSGRRTRFALVAGVVGLLLAGATAAAVTNLRSDETSAGSGTAASQSPSSRTAGATPGQSATTGTATQSSAPSSTSPAASTTAGETTSAAPTSRTASASDTASSSGSATSSPAGAVPAGMRRYTDRTGFSVAVPDAWRTERRGQRVYLRDPGSSAYLLVDQTTDPAADPVADWRAQERVVSRRLPGYRLVRIDPVTVGRWRGADWEFTHGRGTHVLNRNLVTGPNRAYALYWSAPDSDWNESMDRFRRMMASFRPSS